MNKQRRTFIIAEAGVNHNGDPALAKKLVAAARRAGADAIKFQTFKSEKLVSRNAAKAEYQRRNGSAGESQLDMLRRLELDARTHRELIAHCKRVGILFLSTPFDEASADMLAKLDVSQFKISSGEITNHPLLAHVARKKKPIILSTGMATLGEVEAALAVIRKAGNDAVTLLHCVTEYPAPYDEINLSAMTTMRQAFGVEVGYSDHTDGIDIAIAAVALGAVIIEKHFTLDKNLEGPDHKASLEPDELARMIESIRRVERALGDGVKRPARCELKNMQVVRKSVVASQRIEAGESLARKMLTIKRPGTGVAPFDLEKILGRRVNAHLEPDEVITWRHLR